MSQGRLHDCCSAVSTHTSGGMPASPGAHTCPPPPPHLHSPSSVSQLKPAGHCFMPPSLSVHCAPPSQRAGGPSAQSWLPAQTGPPGPPHLHWPSTGSQSVPPSHETPMHAAPAWQVRAVSSHVPASEPGGHAHASPLWQKTPLHLQ